MMKKYRKEIIISCLMMLIPVAVGVALWNKLPDQIPTHFNFSGEIDSYSSKGFTVFGMPLFLIGVQLLCLFATFNDPKNQGDRLNPKMVYLLLFICPAISIVVMGSMFSVALNESFDLMSVLYLMVSIIFVAIGNYLPKCRQNYTVGIKIPWTLDNETNWNKTHRIGGYCFMFAGLLSFINLFIKNNYLFLAGMIVATLIPIVYSYILYLNGNK